MTTDAYLEATVDTLTEVILSAHELLAELETARDAIEGLLHDRRAIDELVMAETPNELH